MLIQPLTHPESHASFLIPHADSNSTERLRAIGIEEEENKYYSIIDMLRKYKNNPEAIQYIADMFE